MRAGQELERRGEALAAALFEDQGWTVLDRNWRAGHAELDLGVRRGRVVAFVEVKTRTGEGCGDPLESITPRKRREVERVARAWLRIRGEELQDRCTFRFDAVAVILAPNAPSDLRHGPDAWCAGDSG